MYNILSIFDNYRLAKIMNVSIHLSIYLSIYLVLYIYIYIYIYIRLSQIVQETWVQSQVKSYQTLKKMELGAAFFALNTIR